jgi:hypothetical protein
VAAADVSSPLEAIEDPPGGLFLRGVYIPMEPSAEQISLIETAIAAEFETVLNQKDELRQMVGPCWIILSPCLII